MKGGFKANFISLQSPKLNELYTRAIEHEINLYNQMNDYGLIDKDTPGSDNTARMKYAIKAMLGNNKKTEQMQKREDMNAADGDLLTQQLESFEKELRDYIYAKKPDSYIKMENLTNLIASALDPSLTSSKNTKAGVIDELFSYDAITKFVKDSFPKATVKDTAPKGNAFGSSVKYDISLNVLASGAKEGSDSKTKKQNLKMLFENKLGITSDPGTAKFHFGQFSSQGLETVVYQDLKESIKNSIVNSGNSKVTMSPDGNSFDVHIDGADIIRNTGDMMVINYLIWRLDNSFPFFINSKGEVLLCSEVINYMNNKNKTSYSLMRNDNTPLQVNVQLNNYQNNNMEWEILSKLQEEREKIAKHYKDKIIHDFRVDLSYNKKV